MTHRALISALTVTGLVVACCSTLEPFEPTTSIVLPTTTTPATATSTPTTLSRPNESEAGNTGLAGRWLQPLDDGVALGVSESDQIADLNDDGDLEDVIVHVITTDDVINTRLEAPWGVMPIAGSGFVTEIYEQDAGRDLNGDGDMQDMVPHIWTAGSGVLGLGVSAAAVPDDRGRIWLQVYEWGEGRDLNGDGDVGFESVAHLWDPVTGLHNTGWAVGAITPLEDGSAVFGVFETDQGVDYDGNGSIEGHVAVWWAGPDEFQVIGPAYAAHPLEGSVLISYQPVGDQLRSWGTIIWRPDTEPIDLGVGSVTHQAIPGGGVYFRVAESPDYWNSETACVHGSDLNEDGDCEDFVLHRWERDTGLVGLGLADWWCPECDPSYVTVGTSAFVSVPSGVISRPDPVLYLVDDEGVIRLEVTPTSPSRMWAATGDGVILSAGDESEFTMVTLDGAITPLGVHGVAAYPLRRGALLLGDEGLSGADLDGDGRITEGALVAHHWDPSGAVLNLGVNVARVADEFEGMRPLAPVELLDTGSIVVLVPERRDLNGDGDDDDAVAHIVRLHVPVEVILGGDGLGVSSLGDTYDTATARLTEALGPPTLILDTPDELMTHAADWFYGGPDRTEVALVWRPLGLHVAFSTYPFFREDGRLHFSGWAVVPEEEADTLVTAEGLHLGMTFTEVADLYGARMVFEDDVCGPAAWIEPAVPGADRRVIALFFDFSGPDRAQAPLVALHAGAGPGC